MPTLAKFLDCLKWPKGQGSSFPIAPRVEIVPVADPELTFGWQGNLYAAGAITGVQAAQVLAAVTIPDDCFYTIDATLTCVQTSGNAASFTNINRVALEILDPKGTVVYQLVFHFYTILLFATAVGLGLMASPPADIFNLRMHLLAGMIVRINLLDAIGASGTPTAAGGSVSLRKLYEENL